MPSKTGLMIMCSRWPNFAQRRLSGASKPNSHPNGGCVYLYGSNDTFVHESDFSASSGGWWGVIFDGNNAPHGVINCRFTGSSNPSMDGAAIVLAGTGGIAQGNNIVGWSDGIRCHSGGGIVQGE